MLTRDLLLEIGCEEIPSRFISGAVEQLKESVATLLGEQRLGYSNIDAWGTPRRLALLVSQLEQKQADLQDKVKGPPRNRAYDQAGNPTPALLGFLRSQDIAAEQVQFEEMKGAQYVVAVKEIAGRETQELLPELLPRLLRSLNFPRPMYWESKEVRFARPIRWLLALYGAEPVSFSFAGITAGQVTYGHRFLAPGPFTIESPAQYFNCLKESRVILNHIRRRDLILSQVEEAAAGRGGHALVDQALLDEVSFLVEYPVVVTGSFDKDFLSLPREVLATSMQVHQRYFPLAASKEEGAPLLPYFFGISNNSYHDNIRKGYEKVLQARLADARFFFDEDRKLPLERYVEQLQSVIYQETLGSMEKKRQRLVELTRSIGERLKLPQERLQTAGRAAHLCKADLVTHMVGEFPELQGVMGREYARLSGEEDAVATAIFEHYLPRHSGDAVPQSVEGALVSLADRFDTLVGCFAVGIQPTGSQDPYALRRQAQGAISILLELDLALSPFDLIEEALKLLSPVIQLSVEQRGRMLLSLREFINQRLRFNLQERGLSYDVVEAVLTAQFSSVPELYRRALALEGQLRSSTLTDILTAYNRVANLTRKAPGGPVDPALFESPAEKGLYKRLNETGPIMLLEQEQGNYEICFKLLQSLREPVDLFFDAVMVMAEEEKLRENRLNLLLAVKQRFNRIADFNLLQSSG